MEEKGIRFNKYLMLLYISWILDFILILIISVSYGNVRKVPHHFNVNECNYVNIGNT